MSGLAYLYAGTNIGLAADDIETEVGNLESRSVNGNTWLNNTGAVVIGGVIDSGFGMLAGGLIDFVNNSPIYIIEDIEARNDIAITAADSMATGDDLIVADYVSVTINSG